MAMDALVRSSSLQHQKRHGLLKDQLRLVKRKDCDRYEIDRIPDTLSFDKGFFLFIRACQLLAQNIRGVVLVGLAGPSGAGKSVFSEKVSNFMPGITVISMDNYNDGSRIIDGNYDDPRVTDYDLLLQNISDLKAGKSVDVPIYDFKSSCRIGYRRVETPSSCIVIVEGIYALSEKLRPLLDLRVSVTGGVHFDLVKRVLRDINRCGQAPEDIIQQVSETVYPMYKAFIEPDLETAHIRIINKFNPFSGLQSPTYILKSSHIVSEEQIRDVVSPNCTEATEETYDIYLLPPGEDPETCQSYLRMRNRDGKYSLMFEECLTDHPFMISPRITFEVSVRLLGGLMALGYTIATILKRVSKVYTDEVISVKIDKLEQLQRKFIQVQGKDRSLVGEAAKKLGLEGSYIPHPYIEQIQLEKLTAEVMALPDDLKTKLSINDTPTSSPMPSFSWISEAKLGGRNSHSRSLSIDHSESRLRKQLTVWGERNNKRADATVPDLLASPHEDQGYVCISEQMVGLNDRIDELLLRLGEVEKMLSCFCHTQTRQISNVGVGSFGNGGSGVYLNGHANSFGMGNGHSPPLVTSMSTPSSVESPVVEELRILARGQHHLTGQLDVISNLLRQNPSHVRQHMRKERRGWWDDFLGKTKTTDIGLVTAVGTLVLGLGGLAGIITIRTCR